MYVTAFWIPVLMRVYSMHEYCQTQIGLHALHEKHSPITICLLWLRICFIAWLILQTSLTFLFFSHKHRLGLLLAFSV